MKVLGWIFFPFIMIFIQWKQLSTGYKIVGTAWAVIAILLGVGPQLSDAPKEKSVASQKQEQSTATQSNVEEKEEPAKEEPAEEPEPPKNDPKISLAEFQQLKTGMSYAEATKIIGGPGEVMSESGTPGGTGLNLHTVMYQYWGESGLGANANLMFQDDKLINKAQFGLE